MISPLISQARLVISPLSFPFKSTTDVARIVMFRQYHHEISPWYPIVANSSPPLSPWLFALKSHEISLQISWNLHFNPKTHHYSPQHFDVLPWNPDPSNCSRSPRLLPAGVVHITFAQDGLGLSFLETVHFVVVEMVADPYGNIWDFMGNKSMEKGKHDARIQWEGQYHSTM